MYNLIRDPHDMYRSFNFDSEQPVFIDTETKPWEGRTKPDGGLYGEIRLVQFFQKHWKNVEIVDCDFVPLELVLELIKPHFFPPAHPKITIPRIRAAALRAYPVRWYRIYPLMTIKDLSSTFHFLFYSSICFLICAHRRHTSSWVA